MTTDDNPNPANEPATYPPNATETPAKPGLPDRKVEEVANRLAHKGAKRQQDFDKDNLKVISK